VTGDGAGTGLSGGGEAIGLVGTVATGKVLAGEIVTGAGLAGETGFTVTTTLAATGLAGAGLFAIAVLPDTGFTPAPGFAEVAGFTGTGLPPAVTLADAADLPVDADGAEEVLLTGAGWVRGGTTLAGLAAGFAIWGEAPLATDGGGVVGAIGLTVPASAPAG
jgi:hypothetical protein